MNDSPIIEKVGFGVDLIGGEQTLLQLRQIRAEMTLISQLTGKSKLDSGSIYSASRQQEAQVEKTIKATEKVQMASIERVARAQANANKKYSQDEISTFAREKRAKLQFNKEVNAELEKQERGHQQRVERDRQIAERRAYGRQQRVQRLAQDPSIISSQSVSAARAQSRLLQRYRRDSARDATTNLYRRQHAELREAQNIALKRDKIIKQELANQRQQEQLDRRAMGRARRIDSMAQDLSIISPESLAASRAQSRLLQRYRNDPARDLRTNIFRKQQSEYVAAQRKALNDQRELDRLAQEQANLARTREMRSRRQRMQELNPEGFARVTAGQGGRQTAARKRIEGYIQSGQIHDLIGNDLFRGTADYKLYMSEYADKNTASSVQQRVDKLQAQADKANERRVASEYIKNDYNRRVREAEMAANRRYGAPLTTQPPGGPSGPNNPPNRPPRNLNDPRRSQLLNDRGFFTSMDMVGRITRNILLYEVVSRASYGLVNYIGTALNAAKATVEYGNALRFATEQQDGNLANNERLASSLLEVGLSRQQGRAAVVEAARFSQERPQDTEALTRTVVNIAAARGLGIDRADELIEQLRRRESKFYKRIFGKTVETIYEDEARNVLSQNTTNRLRDPGLFIGLDKNELRSSREQIADYVSAMDDAAKERAVYNYVLSQASRFEGEAAERATTLAGRMDKLSAAWLNSQEGLGMFITDLKLVSTIMDSLTSKIGVMDALRSPEIQRTGRSGNITDRDVRQFGIDRTTGTRANLLSFIDNWLPTIAVGGAGLAGFASVGRRSATSSVRNRAFESFMGPALEQFGGNFAAAERHAAEQARELSGGLIRSVGHGMKRITVGMSNSITNMSAQAYNAATGSTWSPRQLGAWTPQNARFQGPNQLLNVTGNINQSNLNQLGATASGPFSILPTDRGGKLLDRAQNVATGMTVAGGLIGGAIGLTVGNFIASTLNTGTIVSAGITILGGMGGTAVGSFIGDVMGAMVGQAAMNAGGFGNLAKTSIARLATIGGTTAGIGTLGATALTGGVIGAGLLGGYTIGSALVNPLSQTFNLPYAQQLRDEAELRKIEASQPAFERQYRERMKAANEGRLFYRSFEQGAPTGLIAPDEVQKLGIQLRSEIPLETIRRSSTSDMLSAAWSLWKRGDASELFNLRFSDTRLASVPANYETVFVSKEESKKLMTSERAINRLEDLAKEQGVSLYRTSLSNTGSGLINKEFDTTDLLSSLAQERATAEQKLNTLRLEGLELAENEVEARTENAKQVKEAERLLSLIVGKQEQVNDLTDMEERKKKYGIHWNNPRAMAQIDAYREASEKRERERVAREEKERNEQLQQRANALGKLRNMEQGSFTLVEATANSLGGQDNPYNKVLSEQITLLERMRQQWGWAGEEAVAYFETIEKSALGRQLTALRYQSYTNASNFRMRGAQESLTRENTYGYISNVDQLKIEMRSAMIEAAKQLPELDYQLDRIRGNRGESSRDRLMQTINGIAIASGLTPGRESIGNGNRLSGFRSGPKTSYLIGPDGTTTMLSLDQRQPNDYFALAQSQRELSEMSDAARFRVREQGANEIISALSDYSPQQIRRMGLGGMYESALLTRREGLSRNIEEARQKTIYAVREEELLNKQIKEDEQFRQDMINRGEDAREVGRQADKLLLARTEGMDPRDMSYETFRNRQEALKREAERETNMEEEAREMTARGVAAMEMVYDTVEKIRAAIYNGDMSMLIQVQNDTQARIDQEVLQEQASGNYNVPLDQKNVRKSPYSGSLTRYAQQNRGGVRP